MSLLPDKKPTVQPVEEEAPERIPLVPKERYDLRILKSLRRIIRSVDVHSRRLAQDHGVTVPQLLCLLKIDELGALTIRELADEIYLSPSTLVGIIDRLEKHELVFRRRSVRDRRKVRIELTEAGNTLIAKSPSPLQNGLVEGIEELPELERATIALSLEKILVLMEGLPLTGTPEESAPILETDEDLKTNKNIEPKG